VGRQLPAVSYVYAALSVMLREWNDLSGAVHYAQAGVDFCRQWGQVEGLADNYVSLAMALLAQGDADGALGAMAAAKQASARLSSYYLRVAEQYEARIQLAMGHQAPAERWVQRAGLQPDAEPDTKNWRDYRFLARLLVSERRWAEVVVLLDRLLQLEQVAGAGRWVIELLVLRSVGLQALGQVEQALASLEEALALAEPEGYVRTFVDEGEPMARLLRQAVARGITPGYSSKLLAVSELESKGERPRPPVGVSTKIVEPLSPREVEVLHLVAEGFSNHEIADRLVVSLPTVKKHIEHIHGKLGVRSRTQAVARARELNLL
jgi:LuxR family maltose regulon positive regulatory protein